MERNIDILKASWKRLSDTASHSADGVSSGAASQCEAVNERMNIRTVSRRSRLLRIYRIFFVVAMIYIFVGPMTLREVGLPMWLLVLISLYFGMMACLSWMTIGKIRKIAPAKQNVLEMLRAVEGVIRFRRLAQIVSLLVAVPLLIVMLYMFRVDDALFLGGICGVIFGGVLGIMKDREIREILREIRQELMVAYS